MNETARGEMSETRVWGRTIGSHVTAVSYDKTRLIYAVRMAFHPLKSAANGTHVARWSKIRRTAD